jgi:hypothetical protein
LVIHDENKAAHRYLGESMPVFIIAALLAAAPATDGPAAPAAPAAPVKEKKICRSEEVTGSIMPKRVCRTQAEWNAYQAQIGNRIRDQQRTLPSATGR